MPDLIQLAIPAFIALMVIEAVADAWMRNDIYEARDTAASLTMGMGNVLVGLLSKGMVFALFTWVHKFAAFQLGYQWWVWVLAFFADDFSYYWFHRTSHECRFFWASHVVHHSSQHYNLSTALRQTWTGGFFGFIFWLWMPLVGSRAFTASRRTSELSIRCALRFMNGFRSARTCARHRRGGTGSSPYSAIPAR